MSKSTICVSLYLFSIFATELSRVQSQLYCKKMNGRWMQRRKLSQACGTNWMLNSKMPERVVAQEVNSNCFEFLAGPVGENKIFISFYIVEEIFTLQRKSVFSYSITLEFHKRIWHSANRQQCSLSRMKTTIFV